MRKEVQRLRDSSKVQKLKTQNQEPLNPEPRTRNPEPRTQNLMPLSRKAKEAIKTALAMKKPGQICLLTICLIVWSLVFVSITQGNNAQDVPILTDWWGFYPVAGYNLLPEDQRRLPVGFLDNKEQFSKVWNAFKPSEEVPEVDFSNHLVLFVRNAVYFNRIGIARVLLEDSVAEILAMETRTAFPIEDKAGMALAVISRAGVKYIRAGDELIPVAEVGAGLALDPLNAAYMIEGRRIFLQQQRPQRAPAAF